MEHFLHLSDTSVKRNKALKFSGTAHAQFCFSAAFQVTILLYQTCSNLLCSLSCTLSAGVNHFTFSTYVNLFIFPTKKNIWRSMEKKQENPLGNVCSALPIMHGTDSYSAESKCHLTIKMPRWYAFLRSS